MDIEKTPLQDKTLYVCVNNVGRSQMAERFHNELAPGKADSAGLAVDEPGGYVRDWKGGADIICESMDELDLGIADRTRTQFSEEMALMYGHVILMLEPEQIPENLDLHTSNRRYWPVFDPRDVTIEKVREVRNDIWANVGLLALDRHVDLCPV